MAARSCHAKEACLGTCSTSSPSPPGSNTTGLVGMGLECYRSHRAVCGGGWGVVRQPCQEESWRNSGPWGCWEYERQQEGPERGSESVSSLEVLVRLLLLPNEPRRRRLAAGFGVGGLLPSTVVSSARASF